MSAGTELEEWLNRSEKTFGENLQFGIKVCKSLEFVPQNKYEIVLNWFADTFPSKKDEKLDMGLLVDLVGVTFPQHLVLASIKEKTVQAVYEYVAGLTSDLGSREPIDLLLKLSDNQSFQIFYRGNMHCYCELQRTIFSRYTEYFQSKTDFCPSAEAAFYEKGVTALKNFLRNQGTGQKVFRTRVLEALIESALYMLSEKSFYSEIMEIFVQICFDKVDSLLRTVYRAPLHVSMYCLDFIVNHHRGEKQDLAQIVLACERDQSPAKVKLLRAAHMFDLFRKYDVDCTFEVEEKEKAVTRLAAYVEKCFIEYTSSNRKEVLILICSALRLNPMSLEKIMFRVTIEFMLAQKSEDDWQQYVEFLMLIVDVFKKLGRSEKLVLYLLKSLKGQLGVSGLSSSLKRKLKSSETSVVDEDPAHNEFVRILRDQFAESKAPSMARGGKWKYIALAWPHESVGQHFTEFVTTLMSKPSLVLWKTLAFSLGDNVKELRKAPTDEKNLVITDFTSALLCQYLAGTRLPEQTDKFWKEIQATREVMQTQLQNFGEMLLEHEHNNRTMDTFLEICLHIGHYDLITAFYCPESVTIEAPNLHGYLTKDQWVSLEQRIVNFGNSSTKNNINQLHLQKMKMNILYNKNRNAAVDVNRYLLNHTFDDAKLVKALFEDYNSFWLTKYLSTTDKQKICNLLIPDDAAFDLNLIQNLLEDRDFLELSIIRLYELISGCFDSKKSLVKMAGSETSVAQIRDSIQSKLEKYSIKHCDAERLKRILHFLVDAVPIGFCSAALKPKVFSLNLALYRDSLAVKNAEITDLCFDAFGKLLHFGNPVNIFGYFDIQIFMKMFPPLQYGQFYKFIFESPGIWNSSTDSTLSKLYDHFVEHKLALSEEDIALAIIILQYQQQCPMKNIKIRMGKFVEILVEYIENYFANSEGKDIDQDKAFVRKTAATMPLYLKHLKVINKDLESFTDNIKAIYRKYVFYSQHEDIYTKLIGCAIEFRKPLAFDKDELDLVLHEMWKKLLADIRRDDIDEQRAEKVLRNITSFQTTEQFIRMFTHIEESLTNSQSCKMLLHLTKCSLSAYMGAVLNSCCHILLFNKISSLEVGANGRYEDDALVLSILQVMEALCSNKKNPVGTRFLDDILTFLMDVKIRRYSVEEGPTARKTFQDLYKQMVRVCLELIHCQGSVALNRVPQFVYVFRELLQALVTYRSERLKLSDLDADELEELSGLGHDLENLMHGMARYQVEMKRVAPYLLTYTINAMIVNSKSTVRFPKIKLHIENICYELIALCDHRVKSFILRCSNDATRQIYENLCKDYQKYQKFKGKV